MGTIIEWIEWAVGEILEIIKNALIFILTPLYNLFISLLNFIVDKALSLVEFAIGLVDFKNDLFDLSLQWTHLPDQLIWVLNQCGVDNAILIITSGLLIRLTLNLIPSWATRV